MGERVFCLAHRPVIGESAETAKIRIEYEASANECLLAWTNMWKQVHPYKIDCGIYWYVLDSDL